MTAHTQFVGLGNQVYKVIRPFASWPSTVKIGIFSKGAVDFEGNLYVCQRADPPILVFDRKGQFIRSIGDGREADLHGIWITPDDRVFVIDRDAHQLLCYSLAGELLLTIGDLSGRVSTNRLTTQRMLRSRLTELFLLPMVTATGWFTDFQPAGS